LREHHAGVHQDRRVAAGDEHHVHAELAEPAERDQFERRHTRTFRTVWQTRSQPVLVASAFGRKTASNGHAAAGAAEAAPPTAGRWAGGLAPGDYSTGSDLKALAFGF